MNPARVIQIPMRASDDAARPDSPAREGYAAVLWARGEVDAAMNIWQETLQRDPQKSEVRLELARAWQVLGQWDEAARELSLCLPVHPDHPDLLARLAICYFRTESYPHALVLLDQAVRLDPTHRLASAAQACLQARTAPAGTSAGNGILSWPEAETAPPTSSEVIGKLFEEACRIVELEDHSEARVRLEEVLLLDPAHFDALFEMGQLEESEHRSSWAMRYYEAALRARPQSWEAAFNLARLCTAGGDEARARVLAERALLLRPESAGAAWLLAQLCERSGEDGESAFWLNRTAHLEPRNAEALTRLGQLSLASSNLGEAATWMELAYDAGPERYDTAFNLGLVRWRQGELVSARELWTQARRLDPAAQEAAQALAGLELSEDNIEEAERHLAGTANAGLAFLLGQARAGRGELDPAIAHYRHAVQLNPKWRDAWVNLGALLREAGQEEPAREAWQTALSLDSSLAGEYFG